MLIFSAFRSYGQAQEAIRDDADTMKKYIPEKKLAEAVTIRKIIIEGNKVTRRSIVLREMSVYEGETVLLDTIPELLNQNKLRLVNLTLFNDINLHIERVNMQEVDWYVQVTERFYIIPTITLQLADRNFNTWWVEQNHNWRRADLGVTIEDKNFLGNLETLSVTGQGGYTQQIGVNYSIPYIDKKQKNGIAISASYAKSEQTYYVTDSNKLKFIGTYNGKSILNQFEGSLSYIYRPAYASRHIFELTYDDYKVGDTVIKLNPDYYANKSTRTRWLEFFYRYELNKVDNWNYPILGFKLVSYAIARVGFEGLNFQSYINVEAGFYRNPFPKWYVATTFRGRLMYPQRQPYYFQGGLGTQTDYVRGYEYYVIDGDNYGLIRFDLKREIFNKQYHIPIKYFTALPLRVYPKIFADAGYINSLEPNNSFLSNTLLCSIGAGLDIVTLYDIKIRLEFAYTRMQRNGLYLHLNSE